MNLPTSALSEFPNQVRQMLDGLSDDLLRVKPTTEEFSLAEHVCHLRDIENEGYVPRIHRLLTEDHAALKGVDGARLAIERDYNNENVGDALNAFAEARNNSIRLMTELDDAASSRTAVLEGVGEITLTGLVEMMHDHDASHLEEMSVLRGRLLRRASD
jgi:hypothetical protein